MPECPSFHALYEQDQLTVPCVAAVRVARLQIHQVEAMPPAFVTAQEPHLRVAWFRFWQEVAQPPGEDRDGAATTVLEYQHVDIRKGDLGLQAKQAYSRIQDEAFPG